MLLKPLLAGALIAASFLLSACAAPDLAGDHHRKTNGAPEAMLQRFQARLSEDGHIPDNALMRAKARRDAMAPAASIGDENFLWVGPGNIGGRLRGVCINPLDPNIIYIAAATGGVWKSTNAGASFSPLNDFVPALTIGCMVMDPANPDTLYVGTGEGFFNTLEGSSNTAAPRGAGIFKTTDGGQTWAQLPATANPDWYWVNRIALAPGNSQTMLAATATGIWRSTDGGLTWSRRTTVRALQVVFHPTDSSRALAGRTDGIAQYSTDGGVTWQNATGTAGTRVELAYAPSAPDTVYALVNNGGLRIYRSVDGGLTYTLRPVTSVSTLGMYTGAIWVDPLNANHIVYGGVNLYRTTDGGGIRANAYTSIHSDHHIIVAHPGWNGSSNKTLYFGGDGGLYRTLDSAANTAAPFNNNVGVTQFYGAAIHDGTGVIVAGAQDNYTLRYPGTGTTWTQLYGGDGTFACSDPTNSSYFYGGSQRLNIVRSSNAGISGTPIGGGIGDAGSLNCNFIAYFMLDPNEPNRMLAGGRRLWRSNNVKTGAPPSWTFIKDSIEPPIAPPPPGEPEGDHFEPNSPWNISTFVVAAGNPDIIYVGYNNGQVWKTTSGTAATPVWSRTDNNQLPARWVSRIVIDPANHSRVYISFMGYDPDNIWRTSDGGQTWSNITGVGAGALPAIPVSALALQAPGRIYAGTDIGLFLSNNDGTTWAPVVPGVGLAVIDELVWRNPSTIMVVTHGRGIYLGNVPVPPCYANCDSSTTQPILNVGDFTCFLQRFAAAEPYANCDGSTQVPVLNIADFTCFLQSFAQGCP
jgi:photosystem II stability/assembly factor-like uncharacterized protein